MLPAHQVLIAHDRADLYFGRLRQRFPSVEFRQTKSADELNEIALNFAPTVAYSCTTHGFPRHLHRAILDIASVRWLHVGGSGFEHFANWDDKRLTLTNGVGILAPYLADTVMGAIIALNNSFFEFRKRQRNRQWQPHRYRALRNQKLLIIGTGAVGSALAKLAKAHGMTVIGAARRPRSQVNFDEVSSIANLPSTIAQADWVSLHLGLSASTEGFFDRQMFAAMRKEAFFINTSRGRVVDEAALVDALHEQRIAGAYLDVTATEPLPKESPIWQIDNLFLTPHCSDQVTDWQERHAEFFMDNLDLWLRGQPLRNEVPSNSP